MRDNVGKHEKVDLRTRKYLAENAVEVACAAGQSQGARCARWARHGLGFCPTFNQSAYLLFFPCVVALCAILPDSVSEPQEKNMTAHGYIVCSGSAQPPSRFWKMETEFW